MPNFPRTDLAAEAEADDVPLPLEAEVTNLPIRE